ncbi:P2R1A-PPP2R2A-interacting phosphatase regulator 1-like isoform X1 [Polyodon spathula]|uniref:P2R1A-PPP2R2A-interacting phosphatase regulator 1-like isoform X1 n=1 Tax=Polyodon spathula TaxID=7913 RepID=UPI001B7F77DE|nr:P2R1A-PPP2R2A-interacting phosphatase regulator 1-like isoform X1 [Polyodon spathula]XP_041094311.1 P2R1A-PPP2R2A-interacting phosphatase regulator 1-like isoform X1 [Polyodon spathula]XP_041094312.1 P2R1A-PPP2R2A-interacting phosphatase regulator 1-like isoform X1 [Polyodon spathula]
MERMEVDQCAGAAAGSGGALRRSNSAPMITGVSDSAAVFHAGGSARYRRSSVSVNLSCPGLALPLSPFRLASGRLEPHKQEESMEMNSRDTLPRNSSQQSQHAVGHWDEGFSLPIHAVDSGVTPNSSPSSTRRFARGSVSPSVRSPPPGSLKRKGGVDLDAPPKKLFVAGVPGRGRSDSSLLAAGCSLSVFPAGCVGAGVPVCTPPQDPPPLSLAVSLPVPPSPLCFPQAFTTPPGI